MSRRLLLALSTCFVRSHGRSTDPREARPTPTVGLPLPAVTYWHVLALRRSGTMACNPSLLVNCRRAYSLTENSPLGSNDCRMQSKLRGVIRWLRRPAIGPEYP